MNRTLFALAMGIALLPLTVNAVALETDYNPHAETEGLVSDANTGANAPQPGENAEAGTESPVLDEYGSANALETGNNAEASIESLAPDAYTAEGEQNEATTDPEIVWDAQTGMLTARIDWASIDRVVHALEEAGVEVKTHASWAQVRISASFDNLPLQQAAERLFGNTFMLVWSREPAENAESSAEVSTERPLIRLLSIVDGEAIAGETSPYDAATLEALVASSPREEAVPALEAALLDGDDQLRAAALELIGRDYAHRVDPDILRAVAQEDANPEMRQQALAMIGGRIYEPEASRDALSQALQNDPDANVRAAAEAALSDLDRKAEYLYKKNPQAAPESQTDPGSQARSPLDDSLDYSPLDNPAGLYAIAHGDPSAERRQQALGEIAKRIYEADASWDALNHAFQNDPDANVRATAQAEMFEMYKRARYLYKRKLGPLPVGGP